MYCCFRGTILDLLDTSKGNWLRQMKDNYLSLTNEAPSKEQVAAWNDCYEKVFFSLRLVPNMIATLSLNICCQEKAGGVQMFFCFQESIYSS